MIEHWTDLAEVLGLDVADHSDGTEACRVLNFGEAPDRLHIQEACDSYFGIDLDVDRLDRLIAYLSAQRDRIGHHD